MASDLHVSFHPLHSTFHLEQSSLATAVFLHPPAGQWKRCSILFRHFSPGFQRTILRSTIYQSRSNNKPNKTCICLLEEPNQKNTAASDNDKKQAWGNGSPPPFITFQPIAGPGFWQHHFAADVRCHCTAPTAASARTNRIRTQIQVCQGPIIVEFGHLRMEAC